MTTKKITTCQPLKTLEWKYDREQKLHYSGHYRIKKQDLWGMLIQYLAKYYLTGDELGRPKTLKTAKQLCQKHYNKK